jgi:ribosome-binding protein aMBF1 (putative translation factor)
MPRGRRLPPTYEEVADVLGVLPLAVMKKRGERGISVRAAAKEMGVARNTLTRFEDGEEVSIRFLPPILVWLSNGDRPARRPRLKI